MRLVSMDQCEGEVHTWPDTTRSQTKTSLYGAIIPSISGNDTATVAIAKVLVTAGIFFSSFQNDAAGAGRFGAGP